MPVSSNYLRDVERCLRFAQADDNDLGSGGLLQVPRYG